MPDLYLEGMELKKVPSLQLSDFLSKDKNKRDKFIKDLYNSVEAFGFVVLKNHTIKKPLLKKAYEIQEKLFSLPEDVKSSYDIKDGGKRGYTAFGTENAKGQKVKDLKEFWHVGREELLPNVWPKEMIMYGFKNTFTKIYDELENVGFIVLEALAEGIGLDKNHLKDMGKNGNSILRLLHYPPIDKDADPNAERAKAHTDINLITILVAGTESGLELQTKNGEWIPVEAEQDSIVVNIGDMFSRMTNDKLPSTVHRVVNSPNSKNKSRYSMPFFLHARPEVLLACLPQFKEEKNKYPDITAGDFLDERLKEIGLKK